ncbi:unnamed protein product [Rhizoctonia solani]|uniref:DUF7918 domain-containing protein n=1 Tax=Rhizoctonia solani TaxID=456999 RepID=A0A8H3B0E2_9AGAM|nr:unnamed protein product [Rhizoctonia solani]
MIFKRHGLSVWIVDSDDNVLPEHRVQEVGDNTIQCWVPSTEGSNFKILWKVTENVHPEHDLRTLPLLDGIRMSGMISRKREVVKGFSGMHFRQRTGPSSARLYEFGQQTLTDSDDCGNLDPSLLNSLNTIKLVVDWGRRVSSAPRKSFHVPQEIGPVHEKSVKKGHSGAAKLGTVIPIPASNGITFTASSEIEPVTFMFCYAPEGWLRARDIVTRCPERDPDAQDTKITLKRKRSATPEIIDIDDLETDEEDIHIVKHMVPAPATKAKKKRTSGQETKFSKTEED